MQLCVLPVPIPRHDHVQGPLPRTDVGVPELQRSVAGAELAGAPLAVPQAALTGATRVPAEQAAGWPPLTPEQAHVHGPLPLTALAMPWAQRLETGASSN